MIGIKRTPMLEVQLPEGTLSDKVNRSRCKRWHRAAGNQCVHPFKIGGGHFAQGGPYSLEAPGQARVFLDVAAIIRLTAAHRQGRYPRRYTAIEQGFEPGVGYRPKSA